MDDMTEMAASVAARCPVDRKGSSKPEKTCHWVVGTSLNVRHCRVQGSYARQGMPLSAIVPMCGGPIRVTGRAGYSTRRTAGGVQRHSVVSTAV